MKQGDVKKGEIKIKEKARLEEKKRRGKTKEKVR